MKYLSVCSGVEAATVAWHEMGWSPVAFSEIEPFPSAVLAHHYPNVPNLGDMTKYKEWNLNESVELVVGGTPCQSFSVAGLRKGLEDPRGNLMLTYIGILDRFKPKWCVWENVPGVLSSNGGRDFGAFLGALAELGYGFAYRVLDAQHFGIPQRRRRVFVVGCLGDWQSASKVLFERESLLGNPPKSRSKRQTTPSFTSTSFGGYGEGVGTIRASGGDLGGGSETLVTSQSPNGDTTVGTLLARDYKGIGNQDLEDGRGLVLEPIFYENHGTDSRVKEIDVCTTVTARWGTGGNNVPFVQEAYRKSRRAQSVNDHETWVNDGIANTINTFDVGDVRTTHAVVALAENTIGRQPQNGGNGNGFTEDGPMYTLNATGVHGVSYGFEPGIAKREGEPNRFVEELTPTLRANMGDNQTSVAHTFKIRGGGGDGGKGYLGSDEKTFTISTTQDQQLFTNMAVRRLTPIECERLQGFPDDYTNIPWRKKEESPDGPRYKAMGNSMAVPVMKWIGQRIKEISCP
jgi:DNA (cytosine-5)-methyltransferase 1